MTTRAEIAAAATLAGITNVTAHYRQSLKTGDGFVELVSRARGDNGFGWVDTWGVWIGLPQDVKAAEQWLEEHLAALMESIDRELVVITAGPANRVLGGQVSNGVSITGTREG